ncbi:MAG: hypothetical protein ACK4YP_04235, partial [Myxococcota bacterium]
ASPARRGRFVTHRDARATASALSGHLGRDADVRLLFREATRRGWRVRESGRVNRCAPVEADAR